MTGADDGPATGGAAERPRPAFGEYATTEEQQRRIQRDRVRPGAVEASGQGAGADSSHEVVRQPAVTTANDAGNEPARADGPLRPDGTAAKGPVLPRLTGGRGVDRIIAFVLLAWGLINVIRSIPQMTNYPVFAAETFEILGMDIQLSDPAAARAWGTAAALVFGLGWLATAVVTWLVAKRGRLLFWIPLVGAVVFTVIPGILLSMPLLNDPALLDALIEQLPAPAISSGP